MQTRIHLLMIYNRGAKKRLIAGGCKYAFIYYWIDDETLAKHREKIYNALKPVDSLVKPGYRALIFSTNKVEYAPLYPSRHSLPQSPIPNS